MSVPRCPLCPHHRPPVLPSGPSPCRLLLLGECPHVDEDKNGIPFTGKTGRELDNLYLPILGLPRSEVAVANAVWCSRKDYSNPTPIDAECCASTHLAPLLAQIQPQIIMPMGKIACSLWPEINLSMDHGIPIPGKWGGWSGVLWPAYHPSAGIHSTGFMIPLQADFANLNKFIRTLGWFS